ncbi:MAG: hypothetical protein ACRDJO_10105 [Actinomycetota bacterium]
MTRRFVRALALVAAAALPTCRAATDYTLRNPCLVPLDYRIVHGDPTPAAAGEGEWDTVPARFTVDGVMFGRARSAAEVSLVLRAGPRAGQPLETALDGGRIVVEVPADACPAGSEPPPA